MPRKISLLIVDDDRRQREMLSVVLERWGYRIASAEDGFSALVALRNEIPDVILSDLNMPGMSGFELLGVVRRRFPAVRAIAMSGAYSGGGVPPGVAADAFYEKGSQLPALLRVLQAMSDLPRSRPELHHQEAAPIWISQSHYDNSAGPFVLITCIECLRAFPRLLGEEICPVHQTSCIYCGSLIDYAIVQQHYSAAPNLVHQETGAGMPRRLLAGSKPGRNSSSLASRKGIDRAMPAKRQLKLSLDR